MRRFFAILFLLATAARSALATDIEGVQPAALDQPRVNIHLRRQIKGPALTAGKGAEATINVQAFLDTGASGVMLSPQTADALGVKRATAANHPKGDEQKIIFHDIGVAGGDSFNVSEPVFIYLAPFGKNGEPNDADGYPLLFGPVRAQVGPLSGGLMQMLTGGLDVVGMPAMKGRIAVIDPKPVDTFADTMRATVLERADKTIPKTDRHVHLSYKSFAKYTSVEPTGATGPTLADNPFIDGIVVTLAGKRSTGSWLLDTGAAASMISKKQAAALGITYVEGTEGTGSPKLNGVTEKDQFMLTIGGVGGSTKTAGFFLDTLTVQPREKDPLVYRKAPVFINDITVEDPKTKEKVTLDGVFGMNYLAASAYVSEGALLPDIGKMSQGAYEWIVIDEAGAELGVKLKKELQPESSKIEIKPGRRVPVKK
jgi:hypothetical protein